MASNGPLTGTGHDDFMTVMAKVSNIRELQCLEQFCLEQADQSATPDSRTALRILAENYAAAAALLAAPGQRRSKSPQ
jgi:hypothetical protein